MTYFFMLLAVFIMAFVVAGFLLRDSGLKVGPFLGWMLLFASSATFLFHHLH